MRKKNFRHRKSIVKTQPAGLVTELGVDVGSGKKTRRTTSRLSGTKFQRVKKSGSIRIKICWANSPGKGTVLVNAKGCLGKKALASGTGRFQGNNFSISSRGEAQLVLEILNADVQEGAGRTTISVQTAENPFSFFLRDVNRRNPIFIPFFGVAVTEAEDPRSYEEIETWNQSRGLQSDLDRIETEPEESYAEADAATRDVQGPIWLGLGRDMRIFEMGYAPEKGYWGTIKPRFHGKRVTNLEERPHLIEFNFSVGRGEACVNKISRSLDRGYLPILNSRVIDGDIEYDLTSFVTLEKKSLTQKNVRGTHYLAADGYSAGHMFTSKQQAAFDKLKDREVNREEETVLCTRVTAVNKAPVPRYAWFKGVDPGRSTPNSYDRKTGLGLLSESGRVFGVHRMNGKPMPDGEMSVLLQPGETAQFEILVPHQPLNKQRAGKLSKLDFNTQLNACRSFWEKKLSRLAQISLPEKRIEQMIKAGFLHLDLVTYGLEPKGTVTPTIGIYAAIGSESAPIIQFMDSIGDHTLAERALNYFLDKQHDDGFIQNFGNYMLETGPALWSLGEHYRYTRDVKWVRRIKEKLLKSCEYILAWRKRNLKDELIGKGYGLLDGKCADPEDPFRSFMLNGYACMGLSRAAEMLEKVSPADSKRLQVHVKNYRKDIRTAFFESMARSPVVPLSDGTWVPSAPPWAEGNGPEALFVQSAKCWTHGCFPARDSLLGPLYLAFQEVFDPNEKAVQFLLQIHHELMSVRNVALSQPYYSRHPIIHLRRGETKAFLKAYYNGMQGLADPETFSWWEHYHFASPHKTHEEAWFLMQTRWMLWLEEGKTLRFLAGIPRAWLEDGKTIELKRAATYFGPYSLRVESKLTDSRIEAEITRHSSVRPQALELRLPHPQGKKPISVEGGSYCAETESIRVERIGKRTKVVLYF